MIGSQTTRPRCSHLNLDDIATPACPFVLVSVALYASVYACVSLCTQTDHPQTVGTLLAEEGTERQEGDGCTALNTCDIHDLLWPTWCPSTIPLIMNDPCQNNWLPFPTQWWHHTSSDWLKMIPIQRSVIDAVPLAMQAYLYVVYGQRWIDKSLFCAKFELNQAHERTDACLCESVTTLTASVLIWNETSSCRLRRAMTVMGALGARRHTIGCGHVALHGRPSSSFDFQRCRNAA